MERGKFKGINERHCIVLQRASKIVKIFNIAGGAYIELLDVTRTTESFQLQMGFSFPFLRANNLRSSLLNIRARRFLLSCM